jgi:DNA-binding transcriptional LysR family regulator
MELRHLRYFITVATELHFGRAAEKLHIAQPPLSKQIQDLEKELGFDLFNRTKRSVTLTPAGQAFLIEVNQIFQQLDRAIDIGGKTSRGELGQISIGFVGSATYNILPVMLQQFRDRYPHVRIELHELTTDRQLIWLREGRIDIGLIRPPIVERDFNSKVIFQESVVIALPIDHHLAMTESLDLAELATEPFILFPRELAPGLYDPIIAICQGAGFSPQVVQECIQMQTIVSLVSANMGVSILPESIQEAQRQGVVYKPIRSRSVRFAESGNVSVGKLATIAIVWRSNDPSPTMNRFLEIVLENTNI